jgi:hypothetical protein
MCEQFAARIKPKDPRAWLIAVHDATVSIRQDDPGNVPARTERDNDLATIGLLPSTNPER